MYYVYPALFKPNPSGGYIVTVPDVPGCVTGGKTLNDSMAQARDALCGCLCVLEDENLQPNEATAPDKIAIESNAFVALIDADTSKYRSEHDNRSVRRNVSLPAWLNTRAEQARINCSQVLQEALREKLGV